MTTLADYTLWLRYVLGPWFLTDQPQASHNGSVLWRCRLLSSASIRAASPSRATCAWVLLP